MNLVLIVEVYPVGSQNESGTFGIVDVAIDWGGEGTREKSWVTEVDLTAHDVSIAITIDTYKSTCCTVTQTKRQTDYFVRQSS